MNSRLSNRVNEMATSATLAMAAKARELKEEPGRTGFHNPGVRKRFGNQSD
jgi:hypothetical protein